TLVIVRPGVCGQRVILEKLIHAAVKVVRTTLGDNQDFAAAHIAVFRIGVTGNDAHLLNGFRRGVIAGIVVQGFVDLDAIHDVVIVLAAAAVEGRRAVPVHVPLVAVSGSHR